MKHKAIKEILEEIAESWGYESFEEWVGNLDDPREEPNSLRMSLESLVADAIELSSCERFNK